MITPTDHTRPETCPAWCTEHQLTDQDQLHRHVVYQRLYSPGEMGSKLAHNGGTLSVALEQIWSRPDYPAPGPWQLEESGIWLQLPPGPVIGGILLTTAQAAEVAQALQAAAELLGRC